MIPHRDESLNINLVAVLRAVVYWMHKVVKMQGPDGQEISGPLVQCAEDPESGNVQLQIPLKLVMDEQQFDVIPSFVGHAAGPNPEQTVLIVNLMRRERSRIIKV